VHTRLGSFLPLQEFLERVYVHMYVCRANWAQLPQRGRYTVPISYYLGEKDFPSIQVELLY
jgi:hypothetical protein